MEGAELRDERGGDDFVVFGAKLDGGEHAPVIGGEVAEVGGVELHSGRGGCCGGGESKRAGSCCYVEITCQDFR